MAYVDKILIANRGEIALRIIRSAKKLAIRTVAIYIPSEKDAGYVQLADEAVSLESEDLHSTFLNIEKIVQIAILTHSTAVHPGYGFLSENPGFAKACEKNHIIFAGPCSDTLRLMANKPAAKTLAGGLGIPVILSRKADIQTSIPDNEPFHFPVLIKASYGGGGKGIELVHNKEELKRQIEKSSRAALSYFGNGDVFIEQYIPNARHVEVQLMGDNHNNIIHLYERECSVQRNHQKIIEEAPALFLSPEIRTKILDAAIKIGNAVHYSGAGTVEFLVDGEGNYYFMEMNPRIQVEHAVTEELTGIDIVSEQLRIASGFPLSISQDQVSVTGHAIELRIYAEDPSHEFAPSPLPVRSVNIPQHTGLRIETDIRSGTYSKNQFDPLLIKIIAFAKNRDGAINLLRNEIKNLNIIGPETNTKYLEAILAHDQYLKNKQTVEFCSNYHKSLTYNYSKPMGHSLLFVVALAFEKVYFRKETGDAADLWDHLGYWRLTDSVISLQIENQIFRIGIKAGGRSIKSFSIDGAIHEYAIVYEKDNCMSIKIGETVLQLSYLIEVQNNIVISCLNRQYRISFPGLINTYPETVAQSDNGSGFETGEIISPLHGKVLEINVEKNQEIKKGDLMIVIEAMKSENRILSPKDGRVRKIAVKVGAQVTDRMPLLFLEDIIQNHLVSSE